MRQFARAFAMAAFAALTGSASIAADYPVSTVRIIVPFPPGGSSDMVTRLLAAHLATLWKQSVIVENRPGGNGMLGPTFVAKAPSDGYTLVLAPPSIATVQATLKTPPIDPLKDLAPISQLVESPLVVMVHGKMPAKTLRELIDYAKANPGKLNSGSYAMGSRLNSERFLSAAGIDLGNVGYRGEAPMIAAVAAGELDVGVASPVGVAEFIAQGQLRMLAITAPARVAAFPDVPTFAEAGLPAFDATSWFGLFAPGGTSIEIRRFAATGVANWAKQDETIAKLAVAGFTPKASTPEQMGAFLANETRLVSEIAVRVGLEKQ